MMLLLQRLCFYQSRATGLSYVMLLSSSIYFVQYCCQNGSLFSTHFLFSNLQSPYGFVSERGVQTRTVGHALIFKMGKDKSTSKVEDENKTLDTTEDNEQTDRPAYKELIKKVNVIAKPLASKKLTKKLYKTIKKGT